MYFQNSKLNVCFSISLLLTAISGTMTSPTQAQAIQSEPIVAADPSRLRLRERRALFPGGEYTRMVRDGPEPIVAHVVQIDLTRPEFRWSLTPANRSRGMEYVAETVSNALRRSGALLAINASYFLPFAGGSPAGDDFYPHEGQPVNASGAVIANGEVVSPVETDLDIRINATVCFRASRGLIVKGQQCPNGFDDGVSAGPALLTAGVRQPLYQHDNQYALTAAPRSAIGFSADGDTAWIVAVDGRQVGVSEGISLPLLADLFLELGASDALNLDGGGSTTLAIQLTGETPILLNSPVHTGVPGRERPVANVIALFAAGAER